MYMFGIGVKMMNDKDDFIVIEFFSGDIIKICKVVCVNESVID